MYSSISALKLGATGLAAPIKQLCFPTAVSASRGNTRLAAKRHLTRMAVVVAPKTNGAHAPLVAPLTRPALLGGGLWAGLFPVAGPCEASGPLDPALRKLVLTYGDLAQVTYNNFNPHDGTARKLPAQLLHQPNPDLTIPEDSPAWSYNLEDDKVFYLSATSGFFAGEFPGAIKDELTTNWVGFVAISEPRGEDKLRDIVVAFRGTIAETEWLTNITSEFADWSAEAGSCQKGVRVSLGFDNMYRRFACTPGNTLSMQGQVHVAVRKLLAQYGTQVGSITTCGHSLGGALASMCAFDIATSCINHQEDSPRGAVLPVTAFTFEAPRVGNQAYADTFASEASKVRMLRVVNIPDVVPRVPYVAWKWSNLIPLVLPFYLVRNILGIQFNRPESKFKDAYHHGGTLYLVDIKALIPPLGDFKFPHLADAIAQNHDLENVLSLVDLPSGNAATHHPRVLDRPKKTRGRDNYLQRHPRGSHIAAAHAPRTLG